MSKVKHNVKGYHHCSITAECTQLLHEDSTLKTVIGFTKFDERNLTDLFDVLSDAMSFENGIPSCSCNRLLNNRHPFSQ